MAKKESTGDLPKAVQDYMDKLKVSAERLLSWTRIWLSSCGTNPSIALLAAGSASQEALTSRPPASV